MNGNRSRRRLWVGVAVLGLAVLMTHPAAGDEDPAATLYKEAQEALSQDRYEEASAKFMDVFLNHLTSVYAEDALYWHAFALYRTGKTEDLRGAREALRLQQQRFRESAIYGDAADLLARINGELAKRGDTGALEWVAIRKEEFERQGERLPRDEFGGWDEPLSTLELDGVEFLPPSPLRSREERHDIRLSALNALVQMKPDEAVPTLRKVLQRRDEGSDRLRQEAVFLLARTRSPEAGEILVDVVRNDPSYRVREGAVLWLSSVPGEEVVDVMDEIVHNSEEPKLQERAVVALYHHPSPRATAVLKDLVADNALPTPVRESAIRALGKKRSPEMLSYLLDLFERISDPALKSRMVMAISTYKTEESARWLIRLVRNEKEPIEVRETAVRTVMHDSRVRTADLLEIYDTVPHREIRRATIWLLSRKQDPEATEKLLQIAREEEDVNLRAEAVLWLKDTGDPRAVEILEEIVNQ